MSKLFNLAKMTTATTGTGTITLGSAVSGFLTFAQAGVSNGDVVSYAISDGANREIGTGTYTSSGTTLSRTVINSTNSNSAISLSGSAVVFITGNALDLSPPYVNLRDEKAQNTAGGTFTLGAWRTRTLNTESSDEYNICSLSSNQFTLAAGTYIIRVKAPCYNVGFHQARLQNVTDTATIIVSGAEFTSGASASSHALINGKFTIAASKALEIQHQSSGTVTTQGFGVAANLTTEVYTEVELWKVA